MAKTLTQEVLDPTTPPGRLREILKKTEGFEELILRNPNTPADVLLHLAVRWPLEVLENPAVDLLLLEDPKSWNPVLYRAKQIVRLRKIKARATKWVTEKPRTKEWWEHKRSWVERYVENEEVPVDTAEGLGALEVLFPVDYDYSLVMAIDEMTFDKQEKGDIQIWIAKYSSLYGVVSGYWLGWRVGILDEKHRKFQYNPDWDEDED